MSSYYFKELSDENYKEYLDLMYEFTNYKYDISDNDFKSQLNLLKSNSFNKIILMYSISENKIIGAGTIFRIIKLHNNPIGQIEDVIISQKYRGFGYGKLLIDELVKVGLSEFKCYKIILNCINKNTGFYNKCGFKTVGMEMKYLCDTVKQKIVFIAEHQHYKNWVGKNYYDLITFVRDNNTKYDITIFWTDDNPDIVKEQIKIINPILIVFFETDRIMHEQFNFVFSLNIKTATVLLDMFYPTRTSNNFGIINSSALIHLSNSTNIVNCYKNIFPQKYITCFNSRFININKFKDYNLEKKYDILIYGTRNYNYGDDINIDFVKKCIQNHDSYVFKNKESTITNFYIMRANIENTLLKYSHKYRLKILPEKCIYDAVVANEDLSMLINQSYLTVSCSTIADIFMHKYIEIAASKSVILGNIPSDYEDLLKGNIVEINENMSEEEIITIIDNALSDKDKLNEMSNNLYKKIHEEHNYTNAVENFNSVFSNII
jgi:glucosamine-phosphate N-acetyltransferase